MKISINGFIYHKTAERFIDCFDRYAVNQNTNKFAVSDGVSKSFFPGIWAELLVDTFVNSQGKINLTDTQLFNSIQEEWYKKVSVIVNKPFQKYYVKNFFIQGRPAAATFVGLHFYQENDICKWESFALGDSFLFFIPSFIENLDKQFDLITYLSSKKSFEFNNFPDFFDSRSKINKGKIKQEKEVLREGTFLLMTDALSEWFICEKQNALTEIRKWKTQEDFIASVNHFRKGNLQNDDSAILIINVAQNNSSQIEYENISITNFSELIQSELFELSNDTRHQKASTTIEKISDYTQDEVAIRLEDEKSNQVSEVNNIDNPIINRDEDSQSNLVTEENKDSCSAEQPAPKTFWEKTLDVASYLHLIPKIKQPQYNLVKYDKDNDRKKNNDSERTLTNIEPDSKSKNFSEKTDPEPIDFDKDNNKDEDKDDNDEGVTSITDKF